MKTNPITKQLPLPVAGMIMEILQGQERVLMACRALAEAEEIKKKRGKKALVSRITVAIELVGEAKRAAMEVYNQ